MRKDQDLVVTGCQDVKCDIVRPATVRALMSRKCSEEAETGTEPPLLASMAPFNNFSRHVSHQLSV